MSHNCWLMVEWEETGTKRSPFSVINSRVLRHRRGLELHTGKLVTAVSRNGTLRRAKVVMVSDDRRFLEQQLATMEEHSRPATASTMEPVASVSRNIQRKLDFMSLNSGGPSRHSDQRSDKITDYTYSWVSAIQHSSDADADDEVKRRLIKKKSKKKSRKKRIKASIDRSYQVTGHSANLTMPKHSEARSRTSTPETTYELHSFNDVKTYIGTPSPELIQKSPTPHRSVMTYDQQSQTDPVSFDDDDLKKELPKIRNAANQIPGVINVIETRLHVVEAMLSRWIATKELAIQNEIYRQFKEEQSADEESSNEPTTEDQGSPETERKDSNTTTDSNEEINGSDMMPIGSGKTFVPRHILEQIDWNSYTIATRKLLMALFPRRTLATHSLTGKSSPAFMHKPAKLCLDSQKVSDIVLTVTNHCQVKGSLVRAAITTKCADENKMYRMRTLRKEKRPKKTSPNSVSNENQENVPPPDITELLQNFDNIGR